MCYAIRSQYGLPAYVHNYSTELRRQREEEIAERARLNPNAPIRRYKNIDDQVAVVIGGFKDLDAARRGLTDFKKLKPPEIKLAADKSTTDYLFTSDPETGKIEKTAVNPFQTSFATRNPTLSKGKSETAKWDPFWEKLNADEEYNLLKCKSPWTLVVKQYTGANYVLTNANSRESKSFLERMGIGGSSDKGETLNAAALNAHNLAEALRKLKFEAYVFHTRGASIVTVGAFDSMEDPKLAQTEKAMISLAETLKVDPKDAKYQQEGQLFAQPLPMKIPRPQ
jgi:hypothetical protein